MPNWFETLYGETSGAMRSCIQILLRQFRTTELQELAHKKDRNGRPLIYMDTSACIDRLNEAFTPMGWSYQPDAPIYFPAGEKPTQIAIRGVMTVHTPWGDITKAQWGGSFIKADPGNQKFEFGDDLKGATSDALKKCASLFGISNYLARKGQNVVENDPALTDTLTTLLDLAKTKGLSNPQLLEYCSGITRKTILGAGDLSLNQAIACIETIKSLPDIGTKKKVASATT